ncbi:MAG: hypothetical protein C4586_01880 [Anaerolineaceae bacterium]|nr:MAG: hypothetical protein C4586_01880 [Anaerolineaceae bacterium]
MISKNISQLADRFRRLELHAAHGGREVLRVLTDVIYENQAIVISDLVTDLHENIRYLLDSLPPYAPPLNNINLILLLVENALTNGDNIAEVKSQLGSLQKDASDPLANRDRIANSLLNILPPDTVVYTHTLSETVLGVLLELHRMGKLNMVIVTESRPNNDGWDTARRLAEHNLNVRLTIDAAMPAAIEFAHLMLSGAEIINIDGSVVGKVGAYSAARLCELYKKPLYIVADSNKINYISWKDFYPNPITTTSLGFYYSHPSLDITGNYFDVTPPHLINAYATEKGLITASDIPSLVSNTKVSLWLAQQMSNS